MMMNQQSQAGNFNQHHSGGSGGGGGGGGGEGGMAPRGGIQNRLNFNSHSEPAVQHEPVPHKQVKIKIFSNLLFCLYTRRQLLIHSITHSTNIIVRRKTSYMCIIFFFFKKMALNLFCFHYVFICLFIILDRNGTIGTGLSR